MTGLSVALYNRLLENAVVQLYLVIILNPSSFAITKLFISGVCDLLILCSVVQVKLLQSAVGCPWLSVYIASSQFNLGRLYPFELEHHFNYIYYFKNRFFMFIFSFFQFLIGVCIYLLCYYALRFVFFLLIFVACLYGLYCLLFWIYYYVLYTLLY